MTILEKKIREVIDCQTFKKKYKYKEKLKSTYSPPGRRTSDLFILGLMKPLSSSIYNGVDPFPTKSIDNFLQQKYTCGAAGNFV